MAAVTAVWTTLGILAHVTTIIAAKAAGASAAMVVGSDDTASRVMLRMPLKLKRYQLFGGGTG